MYRPTAKESYVHILSCFLIYIDSRTLQDLEVHLSVNKPQIKWQKAFTIAELWQLWPTSIGIPLHLNLSNSGLMALHGIGKAVMNPSLREVLSRDDVKAKKVEISGTLNPR